MKKLYRNILIAMFAVFAVFAVFSFGSISVHAETAEEVTEEQTTEQTEPVTETEGENQGENQSETTDETVENYTFLGRVWEYLSTNYAEVISTAGTVIAAALAVIVPLFNKKTKATVESTEHNLTSKNSEVITAVNSLIEGYNALTEKYTQVETELEEYNSEETTNHETVAALTTQTKAILEILTTVYANSKNVPQGIKDIINLKYAGALKAETATEETETTEEAEVAEG